MFRWTRPPETDEQSDADDDNMDDIEEDENGRRYRGSFDEAREY